MPGFEVIESGFRIESLPLETKCGTSHDSAFTKRRVRIPVADDTGVAGESNNGALALLMEEAECSRTGDLDDRFIHVGAMHITVLQSVCNSVIIGDTLPS